jgi:putative transposase
MQLVEQHVIKRRAELQAGLGHEGTTCRMERLTTRRTRRINHYLHTASKAIIALLVDEGISTLVVGKNPLWKQEAELGWVNNQHFVQIPQARFIGMLEYKAKLAGIRVIVQEESYTSKASFLDGDPIPTYDPTQEGRYAFSGKRINADVNGSYNILRKALPTAFAHGIEAVARVVHDEGDAPQIGEGTVDHPPHGCGIGHIQRRHSQALAVLGFQIVECGLATHGSRHAVAAPEELLGQEAAKAR